MKTLRISLLITFSFSLFTLCKAQNPTYQQKLFYTCKTWGFVKYFHSNVSTCGVNWDSVLIHCLPLVKNAVTQNDFNNALDTMLNAAGPMAITHAPPCDTVPSELSRNLNFGWMNSPIFRTDVQAILDTIKNNFRPHAECWVQYNNYQYNDVGFLLFPHDSLILNVNDNSNYPDEWHRMLEVFVHWNIINYFNPYNYIHNEPWDSTLYHNIIGIDKATNDEQFYYAFRKITAQNNDAHTEGGTSDGYCNFPGPYEWYSIPLILKYIPNQYVVEKSAIPGISPGDAIVSVNGLTTRQWEDSLRNYISAGDTAVFRRTVAQYMLYGNYKQHEIITYKDSLNNTKSLTTGCDSLYYTNWFYSYYPNDTLADAHWKYWPNCNIVYANVGQLLTSDENAMYTDLQNSSAVIFDIRNYPVSGAVWDLAGDMFANQTEFSKLTIPDITYPGTFYWYYDYMGYNNNLTPYKGKVIILFNEQTQSAAEFDCMILGAMPNVTKIGSQTAGTDGNVTYYRINKYTQTMFTTLGVFYPNGDSTERVGIIPDYTVYPTQAGIRAGRDEVLEKALQVAGGCPLSVPAINNATLEITVYPNPSNGLFNLALSPPELVSGSQKIEVYNMLGEKVYSNSYQPIANGYQLSLKNQPNGIYLYRVLNETGNLIGQGKLVIQK